MKTTHELKEYRMLPNGKLKLLRVSRVEDAPRVAFDSLFSVELKYRTNHEIIQNEYNAATFEQLADAACEAACEAEGGNHDEN